MADLRNRKNLISGGPDVKSSGGALIGNVIEDMSLIPKTATEELNPKLTMQAAGFLADDGLTKSVDRSVQKIKDWNGDTAIVIQEDHSVTLKATFMEALNATVLKSVYGDENVIDDGKTITVKENATELPHRSFCFNIRGNAETKIRLVVPDGQVTKVGDVKFIKKDLIKYDVEIECFSDKDSNKLYQLIDRIGVTADGAGTTTTATKTVTLPSGVSGGAWSIQVDGVEAAPLAYNVTGADIQSALRAAGAPTSVTVTGAAGGPYTVSGGTNIIVDGSSLTGGASTTIAVA